ncbi:hypothetical protein CMI37_25455 [Candidatus Pacearchaeota archaeon]|nr:hypothetical protein [Candidatus Pacearchaeota archaeon]
MTEQEKTTEVTITKGHIWEAHTQLCIASSGSMKMSAEAKSKLNKARILMQEAIVQINADVSSS